MTRSLGRYFSSAVITSLFAIPALQSFAQAPSPPGEVPVALTCRDFQKNPDGSWSPVHPVVLSGMALSPSAHYKKGDVLAGVPLPEVLEKQCAHLKAK
ncbi:MAG: hypothetical protein WBX25_20775 [Rhodomicrobium sp.]